MGFSRQEYWSGLPLPSLMYMNYQLRDHRHLPQVYLGACVESGFWVYLRACVDEGSLQILLVVLTLNLVMFGI